ncbi:MAG: hypothetical protein IT376_04820 [Polyangiaceae bacterium]|nr:hypothetical protein [Polyangiaceae bacterium]
MTPSRRVEGFLRRRWRLFVLGAAAVAMWLQARGLGLLLGGDGPAASTWVASRSTPEPSASAPELRHGRALRDRNPFDSTMGPLRAPETGAPDASAPLELASGDPLAAPICADVRVTIVSEHERAADSTASVTVAGEPGSRRVRAGDTVGTRRVVRVGDNPRAMSPGVWLEGAEGLCQALLFTDAAPPPLPVSSLPESRAGAAADAAPSLTGLVTRSGDGTVILERAAVERLLADPATLAPESKYFAEQVDGKVVGLRLFGVTEGSALHALGVRSGDRLEAIDEAPVTGREAALAGWSKLRSTSVLRLRLLRRGEPVVVEIRIR